MDLTASKSKFWSHMWRDKGTGNYSCSVSLFVIHLSFTNNAGQS